MVSHHAAAVGGEQAAVEERHAASDMENAYRGGLFVGCVSAGKPLGQRTVPRPANPLCGAWPGAIVGGYPPGASCLRAPVGSQPLHVGRRNGCGEPDLNADSSSAIDEHDVDLPRGLVVPSIEDPGFQVRPPARRGQLLNDP